MIVYILDVCTSIKLSKTNYYVVLFTNGAELFLIA